MKNRIITGLIIILLLVSGMWYFTPNQSEQIVSVKISDRGLTSALPIYVALEKGYFEKYNIKPELIKLTTGNDVLNALIANQLDVGEIPIDPLIFAEDKANTGTKISLVGKWSEDENNNFDALFVMKKSEIKSLNDLKNKKIGVFPGITAKTFISHYLTQNGIDTKTIEFVELAPNLQIQSLTSGAITALFAYQPTVTIAEQNPELIKMDESIFNKLGFNYFAIYAFSEEFAKSNSAKKVQQVLFDAIQYMQSNESDSRQILSKYTTLGDISKNMSYFPEYHRPTDDDITGISDLTKFYKDRKLMKNIFETEKVQKFIYTD